MKKDRRMRFDLKELARVEKFFAEYLVLENGAPFVLPGWQLFIAGSMLCWKWKGSDRRVFQEIYIEVPRKNAKSTFISGIGLYLFIFQPIDSAQFYSLASDREQASLLKNYGEGFVRRSEDLQEFVDIRVHHMQQSQTLARWKALHADWRRLDGLNPVYVSFDEFHAQEDSKLDDVMDSAFGSQPEYLYIKVTTAGEFKREKPCVKLNEYAKRILRQEDGFSRDNFFAIIYTPDEGDDPFDESTWIKVNPNLGISKRIEYMRDQAEKAKTMPSKLNDFLTKQLNIWCESDTVWIPKDLWDSCGGTVREEELHGLKCYGGLDLAKVRDLSALVWLFPPQAHLEKWTVVCRFWIPDDDIELRSRRDKVPYDLWRDEGLVCSTPGNMTDFEFIKAKIIEDAGKFDVQELAYDRIFAGEIIQALMDEGMELVPFGQGFLSMASPTAEIERLVLAGMLNHGSDPVLAWNSSNCIIRKDPAGNMKIDKEKSNEKVDGMVALAMALGRGMVADSGESIYEERDIRTL